MEQYSVLISLSESTDMRKALGGSCRNGHDAKCSFIHLGDKSDWRCGTCVIRVTGGFGGLIWRLYVYLNGLIIYHFWCSREV